MSILRTEILHLIVLIKNFHQLLQYYHPEENLLIVLDLPALISICKNSTLFCNVHSIMLSAFDLRNQWKNGQSFDSLYPTLRIFTRNCWLQASHPVCNAALGISGGNSDSQSLSLSLSSDSSTHSATPF